MEYKVLSLKWRPSKFDQVIGQDHITQALSNAIKLNRLAHAFTFSGPRGVGKTSTARILAKKVNNIKDLSESADIIEMDAASNRGIDEIRNLKENIIYSPIHSKYKIYIIDEVHMLTKEAFNALLKTLEEPPPYVIFILATTELHKMPETIISRTQRYEFKRLSDKDIISQMNLILTEEKIKYDDNSLSLIAQKSDGSMRDALSILDQMICYCNNNITFKEVQKALGIVTNKQYIELLSCVGERKVSTILNSVNGILNEGISINQFIDGFSQFLRNCILLKSSPVKDKENIFIDDVLFDELDLLRILDLCLKFQINIKNFKQPQIVLETLMIKLSFLDNTINISQFLHDNQLKSDNKELQSNDVKTNTNSQIKADISTENNNKIDSRHKQDDKEDESKIQLENKKSNIDAKVHEKNNKDKDNILQLVKDENNKDINVAVQDNKSEEYISNINLSDVENEWPNIMKIINEKNSKTAIFLENINFNKIENNKLFILVSSVNEFSIRSLEKDISIIENAINKILNSKIVLVLNYDNKDEFKDDLTKTEDSSKNDEDHPLFMDVLEKFDGKIIN